MGRHQPLKNTIYRITTSHPYPPPKKKKIIPPQKSAKNHVGTKNCPNLNKAS